MGGEEAGERGAAGYDCEPGEAGGALGRVLGYDGAPREAGEDGEDGGIGLDAGVPGSAGAGASRRRVATVVARPEEAPAGSRAVVGGDTVPEVAAVAM